MTWTFTSDAAAYAAAVEPWLLRDPVSNTVPLTVLRGIRDGLWTGDLLLGRLEHGGRTVAAAIQTPPHFLVLPDIPADTVPELAERLAERGRPIPGVTGPLPVAEAFAACWWRPEAARRPERLYRLGSLHVPDPLARGASRTAVADDLDLLVKWAGEFQDEADHGSGTDLTPLVAGRIARSELVLWEADGRPVAFAGASTPLGGMSRVGPVYTPPELRGRGYGIAASHAVSAKALAGGAGEVLLFTDLANPTSNRIYQAIGYRPVSDYASITFA
ncbi:putative GNAT family acetyltransferase [Streptosporangium becharense]|uniref:Putative GNAT family acetyltransferase n=1 Tax=Streptosporangium becharense TaxID=1816182 RepID=A0A7W9IKZ4_9ACTN|nr:GNAT family N-acetyltransferase [Streptosporangium becharense]MBB2910932.1 putative GNAT family acetyltransferase [Streptosporangium becharense]MBB5822009.1 putative GNAT family acetyltransferase [Streptosporangium becharense]